MKYARKDINAVIEAVLETVAWRGVKYLDPKHVIRVTRRWSRHQKTQSSDRIQLVVSFTRPNYREREFLAACAKASEPLPVKKVQLQFKKPTKPAKRARRRR